MDIDKIKQMIEDGFAYKRVQQILNISKDDLINIKKQNFQIKIEDVDENKICKLYAEGVSIKNLAIKFDITHRIIKKILKRFNITIRNNIDTHRFFTTDEHKFDIIDSPEKAYWLGFLYADATISEKRVSLYLKSDDVEHIKKFMTFLNISHSRIKTFSGKIGDKIYYNSGITVFSKYLAEQMAKLGCPPRKSFIIKYPYWLDENLHSHFIRGYFEGDGCITRSVKSSKVIKIWDFSIISTKENCDGIKNIIQKYLNIELKIRYKSKTGNNTYNLSKGGNEQVLRILDYLYKDSEENIRLDRKYELYQELKEQQDKRQFLKSGKTKTYLISQEDKQNIIIDIDNGMDLDLIAEKYGREIRAIKRIFDRLPKKEP